MTTSQRVVLLLLIASLAIGMGTGNRLYYRLSYLWGLVFFGSWLWSYLSLRGLKFERKARTLRAQVGQIFEERFEVQNKSRLLRLWMEVQDESPLPGARSSRILTLVHGRQGRSYLARTRLLERGVFPLGPTTLSSGDIFGLFPTRRQIPAEGSLLVFPLMVEVGGFPNLPGLLPGGEALRRRTPQVTPNAAGVREYVPGDPLSRIHWLSTARRDKMMVKEFELDPLADVWVFLDAAHFVQASLPRAVDDSAYRDFWQKEVKITLPPSTEEYAVSIAASLARHYLRNGRAVGFMSAGSPSTSLPPDRGGRQLGKILEALALLKAKGEMPLRGLVETQAKHITRGSTVVVITPSVILETALIFDHLLRRGLRPIAVLLDAGTFGGSLGADALVEQVRAMGVPTWKVACGDDLEEVLSNGGLTRVRMAVSTRDRI